jgi:hypothetical protein
MHLIALSYISQRLVSRRGSPTCSASQSKYSTWLQPKKKRKHTLSSGTPDHSGWKLFSSATCAVFRSPIPATARACGASASRTSPCGGSPRARQPACRPRSAVWRVRTGWRPPIWPPARAPGRRCSGTNNNSRVLHYCYVSILFVLCWNDQI